MLLLQYSHSITRNNTKVSAAGETWAIPSTQSRKNIPSSKTITSTVQTPLLNVTALRRRTDTRGSLSKMAACAKVPPLLGGRINATGAPKTATKMAREGSGRMKCTEYKLSHSFSVSDAGWTPQPGP